MLNSHTYNKYTAYAQDVIAGKIVACQYIKLACHRFLSWFDRTDIEFRADVVDRMINFIGKLKHFQGKWAGKPFILEEWQKFLIYACYGWYYVGTNDRVVRHVILDCARKQGKSFLVSALAMWAMIGEKESGAEIDIVANSRQQAHILFDMCIGVAKRIDRKGKYLKPTLHRIKFPATDSFIQVLASDAATLDGYGASFFVEDEMHAAKDLKLYNVLASSQGARHNPMSWIVTTAGLDMDCPYYEIRKSAIQVLKGEITNDSLFAAIYTLDEGDDIKDESVWIKSNPNLGVSVSIDYIRDRISQAIFSTLEEIDVRVKTMNTWVQAEECWIEQDVIKRYSQTLDLARLKDEQAYVGIDLSETSDITSVAILFPPNREREYYPDKYLFSVKNYLPEKRLHPGKRNTNLDKYIKFVREGSLVSTNGDVVDYDYCFNDLKQWYDKFYFMKVAFDDWNAEYLTRLMEAEGWPIESWSQSLGNFNRPTKLFEVLLRSGKVILDYNSCLQWCFTNVVMRRDGNGNIKPDKSNWQKKIDPVIALLQALGIYSVQPQYNTDWMQEGINEVLTGIFDK